jgi:hypothetical protein
MADHRRNVRSVEAHRTIGGLLHALKPFRPCSVQWTRVLGEMNSAVDFNASTLDSDEPAGGDQVMALLKEMNDLEAAHDEFGKILASRMGML